MGAETPIDRPISIDELLEHAAWLTALARRLVADSGAAEDLVQDTWVRALEAPPSDRRNLRGWLGRVLTNGVRAGHRRGRRQTELAEPEGLATERTPEALAAAMEGQRLLAGAVAALAEPYRETLILRYWHGLDARTIARRQGIAAGTVRWRLSEGLERLRGRLDDRSDGDRRAWCAVLLPLARQPLPAAPGPALAGSEAVGGAGATGTGSLSVLLQGLLGMHLATKLALCVTALTLTYLGFESVRGSAPEGDEAAAPPRTVASAPIDEPAERSAAAPLPSTPTRVAAAGAAEASAATPAAPPRADLPVAVAVELVIRVLDEAGAPVHAATVAGPGGDLGAQVDAAGLLTARLPGRHGSRVELAVAAPGYAREWIEAVVPMEGTLHLGEVRLGPGIDLEGRVVDARGAPVSGAWVDFRLERLMNLEQEALRLDLAMFGNGPHAVSTDAAGRFELPGVPLGPVHLVAGAEGHGVALSSELVLELGAAPDPGELELRLSELDTGSVIAGRVLAPDGSPVAHAIVRMHYRRLFGSGSAVATTDELGRFSEVCAKPSIARTVTAADTSGRWGEVSVEDVRPGGAPLELRLPERRPLAVEVHGPDGRLLDPEVRVVDERGSELRGSGLIRSAEVVDGVWTSWLPSERFYLAAGAAGHEQGRFGPFDPTAVPELIRCDVERIATLRGVARRGDAPVAGARVVALEAISHHAEVSGFPVRVNPHSGVEGLTDEGGRFELTLREAGRYYLQVRPAEAAALEVGPFDYRPEEGRDLGALTLGSGGAIEGRVRPSDGSSPAGRIVGISRGDGRPVTQRVGPDGVFRFERLTPGPWQVRLTDIEVQRLGFQSSSSTGGRARPLEFNCTVVEGQTAVVDLGEGSGLQQRVQGRLVVDGQGARGFRASLAESFDHTTMNLTAYPLDEDGRFEIPTAHEGPVQMSVNGEGFGVLVELDIDRPLIVWEHELDTAVLDVDGLEHVPGIPAFYVQKLPASGGVRGGLVGAALMVGEDGTVRGARIPAGRGRLVAFDPLVPMSALLEAPALAEVEVEAGATARVRLD